jgi:hypothetical protein
MRRFESVLPAVRIQDLAWRHFEDVASNDKEGIGVPKIYRTIIRQSGVSGYVVKENIIGTELSYWLSEEDMDGGLGMDPVITNLARAIKAFLSFPLSKDMSLGSIRRQSGLKTFVPGKSVSLPRKRVGIDTAVEEVEKIINEVCPNPQTTTQFALIA